VVNEVSGQAAIGTIGEYTTLGATVNSALVSGLDGPVAIAVSGSNLFVANLRGGTIGEYTTSGATVNASLVPGLSSALGIAVVPEPGAGLLVMGGVLGLAAIRRRAVSA
jgi:hypothetical protein